MRILVLCTGNSARSQMAEGFLRSFDDRLEVVSAGSAPSAHMHPLAVRVMAEKGIDIAAGEPKKVDRFLEDPFDFVITVCDNARESCPLFVGAVGQQLHISFPDPAAATGSGDEQLKVFREVRDDVESRFRHFYESDVQPNL